MKLQIPVKSKKPAQKPLESWCLKVNCHLINIDKKTA
jgi:hypothetical protein